MKKIVFIILISNLFAFSQTSNEKYHRAKIHYNSIENLDKLELLGIPVDHGNHKKGKWVSSDFSDSEILLARNLGLQVDIEIIDISKFYVDQNKNPQKISQENITCPAAGTSIYVTPTNFNLGSMGGYLTYAQMLQELDDMRALYPNLISARENVGTFLTYENRALQWTKITKNVAIPNTRPQALYTAIHHAREPISMMQTIYYMWYLLENYETSEEIRNIVDNTEMYFIPVINPDGYVYNETSNPNGGGMWRKNRRSFPDGTFGVDNNRNYDYWVNGDSNQSIWNTLGVSATTGGATYPGTSTFSEPENQAIKFFVEDHNFKIALNAHTFSNLLLYSYGYDLNVPSPDDAIFNKMSKLLVKESKYTNQIASALYAASGDSDDWMYGQTFNHDKIFAFTPEIGSSFWPPSSDIIKLCNEMMFTNKTAAKILLDYGDVNDTAPDYIGATATFQASFELSRFGLTGNGNFTVSINPISENIIYVGAPFNITNMASFDVINATIQLGLANGITSGDVLVYELVLDNGLFQERKLVSKKFGGFQTIITDNASTIAPTWTGSTATAWNITSESFVSPSTAITDSPNANYLANQTKTITFTNPINLANLPGATISFWTKFDLENNFDYVQFQVSTNNGVTWTSQCGRYTNSGNTDSGQPTEALYDGEQLTWVKETIDLSDYIGQTIKVRFRFKSDGFDHRDGFYFDDFQVNALQNTVLKTNDSSVSQFGIYPNPSQNFLNINTIAKDYQITIFNLQGQVIMNKENNDGFQKMDTQDLIPGLYLLELKTDDRSEIKKFYKN